MTELKAFCEECGQDLRTSLTVVCDDCGANVCADCFPNHLAKHVTEEESA